jgi:hypothetical protein
MNLSRLHAPAETVRTMLSYRIVSNSDFQLLATSASPIIFFNWSWPRINFEVLNLLEPNFNSRDSTRRYFMNAESLKN